MTAPDAHSGPSERDALSVAALVENGHSERDARQIMKGVHMERARSPRPATEPAVSEAAVEAAEGVLRRCYGTEHELVTGTTIRETCKGCGHSEVVPLSSDADAWLPRHQAQMILAALSHLAVQSEAEEGIADSLDAMTSGDGDQHSPRNAREQAIYNAAYIRGRRSMAAEYARTAPEGGGGDG